MTNETFKRIEKNIMDLGLDMDSFYKSATSNDLAVDFIINNKQEFQGNINLFIDLFDDNFRAKYTNNIKEVKSIIFDIMTDIF